jgi:hypothetical protein
VPDTVEGLAELLVSYGMAGPGTVLPCTSEEVEEVRRAQGVERLPAQYTEFLLTMGRRAGELLRGTDFFYPGVVEFARDMREMIVENAAGHLVRPGSVFVGMHQGYQLFWLEPGDPSGPLYWYNEGEETPRRTWPTLLDSLAWHAGWQKQIRERIRNGTTGDT